MASSPGTVADPPRQLVVEWSLCGIAVAAARFIPVPLVDDVVKENATQFAVHRTLRVHDRTYADSAVAALYGGVDETRRAKVLRALKSVPRRIIFFPVRKYVAIFGAVRGVPNDVMRVVLLGRTVHRALAQGRLKEGTDRAALEAEAVTIRAAYDEAIRNQDFRLLRGALADGLSQGRGLTKAAVAYSRDAFARDDEPKLKPGGAVEKSAQDVEAAMRRPDVVAEIEAFDKRVDEQLAKSRR